MIRLEGALTEIRYGPGRTRDQKLKELIVRLIGDERRYLRVKPIDPDGDLETLGLIVEVTVE